jgi:hypothetical protein
MKKTTPLACALVLAASFAAAQDTPPAPDAKPAAAPADAAMAMPTPAPEMQKLSWFLGRWSCTGAVNDMPGMKGHKTQTNVNVHSDLNGFWVSGLVEEVKTAVNAHPLKGMFHETWDPSAKQFTMLWVDNMGSWASSSSPGWDGDSIVYTGEGNMGGQKMGSRDGFTKKGEREMLHKMEMQMGGQWLTLGEETCRKSGTVAAKPVGVKKAE